MLHSFRVILPRFSNNQLISNHFSFLLSSKFDETFRSGALNRKTKILNKATFKAMNEQDFPAISKALLKFKERLGIQNELESQISLNHQQERNLSEEECSEDSLTETPKKPEATEIVPTRTDVAAKDQILSFIKFHETSSNDYAFNFSKLQNIVEESLSYTRRRNNQRSAEAGLKNFQENDRHLGMIFLQWKIWSLTQKAKRAKFGLIRRSLYESHRVRRFIPLKAQKRCVDRMGKFQLAKLFCEWKYARIIFSAFLENSINRKMDDESENEK
jgi:hypothetical protein